MIVYCKGASNSPNPNTKYNMWERKKDFYFQGMTYEIDNKLHYGKGEG